VEVVTTLAIRFLDSDISLTMKTYTNERLLNSAGAVELLPNLPIGGLADQSLVTPTVTPEADFSCQFGATDDKIENLALSDKNPKKRRDLQGFKQSGRQDLNLRPLRPERSALPG